MLGQKVAAALAAAVEARGPFLVEKDDRFGGHGAAFGGAERQHIDAGLPGRFIGRRIQARQRIAQPRAVHVDAEPRLMGDRRQR